MNLSWDIRGTIQPRWRKGSLPTLIFPGERQKNREDDETPLLPGFESLLLETPKEQRRGYVFNPASIGPRKPKGRPRTEWVGKVIGRIGEASGVVIEPATGKRPRSGKQTRTKDYKPPVYASAHDLRRTFSDLMEAAGIDPRILARVMRHKSYETTRQFYATGNVQRDAASIRQALGKQSDDNAKDTA